MDDIDKAILNRIQSDFPIASRPFLVVAVELDLTETEVLERIRFVKIDIGRQPALIDFFKEIGGRRIAPDIFRVETECRPEGGIGLSEHCLGLADARNGPVYIRVVAHGNADGLVDGDAAEKGFSFGFFRGRRLLIFRLF